MSVEAELLFLESKSYYVPSCIIFLEGNCERSALWRRSPPVKLSEGKTGSRPRGFPCCSFTTKILKHEEVLWKRHYLLHLLHISRTRLSSLQWGTSVLASCSVPPQEQLPCTQVRDGDCRKDIGMTQGKSVPHLRDTTEGISASNE